MALDKWISYTSLIIWIRSIVSIRPTYLKDNIMFFTLEEVRFVYFSMTSFISSTDMVLFDS